MAEPFLTEIRIMSFNFAPRGWAKCDGQLLPINQNQALFALMGNFFGGNGQTTFALPDLRGRVPIHQGQGHTWTERGGQQTTTLTAAEMPTHTHLVRGTTSAADSDVPIGNFLGAANNAYGPAANLTPLDPTTVTSVGGGQPHDNMQPFLALNFCIAIQGIFPSQSG